MGVRARAIWLVLTLMVVAAPASAQRRMASAAEVVAQATLVASGDLVEFYKHGVFVSPASSWPKRRIAGWKS